MFSVTEFGSDAYIFLLLDKPNLVPSKTCEIPITPKVIRFSVSAKAV